VRAGWNPRTAARCLAIGAAALLIMPASGLASSSFKKGIYKGTTSQGYSFEFGLVTAACPRKRHLCLYTPSGGATTEAYINEPGCTDGGSTNAYVDLVALAVPSSGIVHNTSTAFSTVVVTVKISHHGTMSGTFEATGLPGGTSAGCTSGVVTFTAKRS
jgi:hypothetical protein